MEYTPPPPEPEEEAIPMMIKEPSSHQKQYTSQILEGMLGDLEPKGSKLAIVHPRLLRRWQQLWRGPMRPRKTEASGYKSRHKTHIEVESGEEEVA